MSLFGMSWFKKNKPQKEEVVKVMLPVTVDPTEYVITVTLTPYKSVKMVNDVLTVVLPEGDVIAKPSATVKDFEDVVQSKTVDDILKVVTVDEVVQQKMKEEKEVSEITNLVEGFKVLKGLNDFVIKNDSLYIVGTERSIPQLVASAFMKAVGAVSLLAGDLETNLLNDVAYTSLKKFWLKCCLNPSAQSAEDLYTFLSNHQFKIDRHGNFYAYRRVIKVVTEGNDLVDFISNTYNKVKAVWKKKPLNFGIYSRLGEYKLVSDDGNLPSGENPYWERVGNLDELYKNLPKMTENRYTDQHTHSFDYRVGQSVSMPRDMGDDNNQISCSKGFHAASIKYDYSGFGNTPILMIINPIDVLAVPLGEVGKLRVCRWFFAMTLPENEKFILEDDAFDVTELGDVFEEECMTNLQEYIQTSFAEEVKRHTFAIPQISAKELSNVVDSLSKMKDAISKRVSIIK